MSKPREDIEKTLSRLESIIAEQVRHMVDKSKKGPLDGESLGQLQQLVSASSNLAKTKQTESKINPKRLTPNTKRNPDELLAELDELK
jgi:hypothetical protein